VKTFYYIFELTFYRASVYSVDGSPFRRILAIDPIEKLLNLPHESRTAPDKYIPQVLTSVVARNGTSEIGGLQIDCFTLFNHFKPLFTRDTPMRTTRPPFLIGKTLTLDDFSFFRRTLPRRARLRNFLAGSLWLKNDAYSKDPGWAAIRAESI
jgi:hypothetical protein